MSLDRKAAIRDYKESPRPAGVFGVRNTASGRVLLGSSVDLPAMLNRQRFQLEMGSHPSRELQAEWDELGAGSFAIEVLDTLDGLDEPGRDAKTELASLLEIWHERLGALMYRR